MDPTPGKDWWTKREVARYLSISARTLDRIREEDPTFPTPRVLGKPSREADRYRWNKWEVVLWANQQRHPTLPPGSTT